MPPTHPIDLATVSANNVNVRMRLPLIAFRLIAGLAMCAAPMASGQDLPPAAPGVLLRELKLLKEKQSTQSKQTRQTALQAISAALANPDRALQMWTEAVCLIQFNGVTTKDNPAFKEWSEKEGEALNTPICRNAIRLHFTWLALTIQKEAGASGKELLPQVINYVKDLLADEASVEGLEETVKKEPPAPKKGQPVPPVHPHRVSDDVIRKAHDSIIRRSLAASPIVQSWKIAAFIDAQNWEKQPGNIDGIYTQFLLPEMRNAADPRAVEYWDLKIRKEGNAAARSRLAVDLDKFTAFRRPVLLWGRAEELLLIGQQNRAFGEMLALIKASPVHPDCTSWINRLEGLLGAPAQSSRPSSGMQEATGTPPPAQTSLPN